MFEFRDSAVCTPARNPGTDPSNFSTSQTSDLSDVEIMNLSLPAIEELENNEGSLTNVNDRLEIMTRVRSSASAAFYTMLGATACSGFINIITFLNPTDLVIPVTTGLLAIFSSNVSRNASKAIKVLNEILNPGQAKLAKLDNLEVSPSINPYEAPKYPF